MVYIQMNIIFEFTFELIKLTYSSNSDLPLIQKTWRFIVFMSLFSINWDVESIKFPDNSLNSSVYKMPSKNHN